MEKRERVEQQLRRIGCNFRFWGRSELDELCNILMDTETVTQCVNGHYVGGFALLCATDHRVLLVDKKPMNYLTVEDIRFEMISEFDYSHRLLDATIRVCTPTKTLTFTSWNQQRLRALLSYIQQRVIEIRQYYYLAQQFQMMGAQNTQRPAYVPNLAYETSGGGGTVFSPRLPHFKRHSARQLGTYAVGPGEVYQKDDPINFQNWLK